MRLRAISLENVRRFIDPVEITGITDGLNVLTAPNEHGKSTVFDALHAVFFKDRKSWDKEVRSLVPHAGGDPLVAVEIELGDGIYRIEKLWNSRRNGDARIMTSGRLIKQADDAEAWIAEALKSPKDGGPAGLLWVRQGLTGLDGGDSARLARRDLLTSVAGEVEVMTGGRQMDAARDKCRQELERYLTKTGRAKAEGPLKHKEDESAALQVRRVELAAKSSHLQDEFNRRRDLRRELSELESPEEKSKRKARLAEAEAAHAEASRHAEALERAKDVEHAKRLEAERSEERLAALEKALSEAAEATEAYRTAKEQEAHATEQQRLAEAAMSDAVKAHEAASSRSEATSDTLRQVMRAQASAMATERRQEWIGQLKRAEELRQQVEQASADAKTELSDRVLTDLEALDETVRVLRRTRDLQAAAITMAYTSGRSDGISLDGKPLQDGKRTTIPNGARLEIEGIGQLTVHPGRQSDGETLATAEASFAGALASASVGSIDDARASVQRRRETEALRRDAEAALRGVAPKGIETLREQIAALPEQMDGSDDLPTADEAQEAGNAAGQMLDDARDRLEAARSALGQAEKTAARASAAVESAEARVARASAALDGIDAPEAERTSRRKALSELNAKLAESIQQREEIAATAPNLEAVAAALERARSIVTRAEDDRHRIRLELGKLDTSIEIQVGEAVDEELADVDVRLEAAQRALNELNFEIAVLKKLDAALETARASARDRYVEPVLIELGPLLRLLWPEADLRFDAEKLLPTALVRSGTEEDFDILSVGTQEQIALLVRLAFARMLANTGAFAPVILDDAIVYTDDDRIERMFDALTRQAQDLQIIVFSCRQKAFRDLGGRGLHITPANPTLEVAQ